MINIVIHNLWTRFQHYADSAALLQWVHSETKKIFSVCFLSTNNIWIFENILKIGVIFIGWFTLHHLP